MLGGWLDVTDIDGTHHLLNTAHIVRVSAREEGRSAGIILSDGIEIYLKASVPDVINYITDARSR